MITAALVSAANYNVEIRWLFNRLAVIGESGAQFVATDRTAAALEKAPGPSPASYRVEPASIRGHASAGDGLAAPISLASVGSLGLTPTKAAGTEYDRLVASAVIPAPIPRRDDDPPPVPSSTSSENGGNSAVGHRPAPTGSGNAVSDAAPRLPMQEAETTVRRFSSQELTTLLAKGDAALLRFDITSARLFYQAGAAAGDSAAAVRLGATFELTGDAQQAALWYHRARDLGNQDAEAAPSKPSPGK